MDEGDRNGQDPNEASFNETAFSIHIDNGDMDKEMNSLNPYLVRFIKEELEAGIKFDNF